MNNYYIIFRISIGKILGVEVPPPTILEAIAKAFEETGHYHSSIMSIIQL